MARAYRSFPLRLLIRLLLRRNLGIQVRVYEGKVLVHGSEHADVLPLRTISFPVVPLAFAGTRGEAVGEAHDVPLLTVEPVLAVRVDDPRVRPLVAPVGVVAVAAVAEAEEGVSVESGVAAH